MIFAVLDVSLDVNLCINCSFLHLFTIIVRFGDDAKVEQEAGQLLFCSTIFLFGYVYNVYYVILIFHFSACLGAINDDDDQARGNIYAGGGGGKRSAANVRYAEGRKGGV